MNWKHVIADIQRHGKLTQPQIAARVGCSQATVSELATGVTENPRWMLGAALVSLLTEVTRTPVPDALSLEP